MPNLWGNCFSITLLLNSSTLLMPTAIIKCWVQSRCRNSVKRTRSHLLVTGRHSDYWRQKRALPYNLLYCFVPKTGRHHAFFLPDTAINACGTVLVFVPIQNKTNMENLNIITQILLKVTDLELKKLLLEDLQQIRSNQVA